MKRTTFERYVNVALKHAGVAVALLNLSFVACSDRSENIPPTVSIVSVRLLPDSSTPIQVEIECDLKVTNNASETVTFNSVKSDFVVGDDSIRASTQQTFAPLSLPAGQSETVQITSSHNYGMFALDQRTKPRVRVTLLNDDAIVLGSTELQLPTPALR